MDFDEECADSRTIYCGNLGSKVTEEILYELFLQAGPLEKVSIPTDRDGRLASYGFVTFKHKCSVEYALRLFEGIHLYNCRLNLKPRKPDGNSAPNSPQPQFQIQMPLSAPVIPLQLPFLQFNNFPANLHLAVPLVPVHNNQNRNQGGRNENFRNESLQGRFASHSSKRDKDNMRPNDNNRFNNYKRHKR